MEKMAILGQLEENFTRSLQNHSKHAVKKEESPQEKQQIQENNQSDEDAETYPNEGEEEEQDEQDQNSKNLQQHDEVSQNNEDITVAINKPFVRQKQPQKIKFLNSSTSRLYNLTNKSMNSTITTTPQAKQLAQQLSPLNFSSQSSKIKSFKQGSSKYMQFISNARFVNPFLPNDSSSNALKKTLTNREDNKLNNTMSYSNFHNNSLQESHSFQTFRGIHKQAQNLMHSPSNKTFGDKGQNESCHEQQYLQNSSSRKGNTLRLISLEKRQELNQEQQNGSINYNSHGQTSINWKNKDNNDLNKKKNNQEIPRQSSSSMLSQSMTSPRMLSSNTSSSLKQLNPSIKEPKNYPQSHKNQSQLKQITFNSMSLKALPSPQAASSVLKVQDFKQSTPNRSQQQVYEFHQNPQYSHNTATSPGSYLKITASSPALEEMSENFRSSLSIIDRNEMKKFAIEKELQVVLQPKNEEPEKTDMNVFKSNMRNTKDIKHLTLKIRQIKDSLTQF